MNICIEYLYRDAGNNKIWGEIIFTNKNNINPLLLKSKIKDGLIDGEFFIAEQVGLPPLRFERYDEDLDHGWHEYYALKQSPEKATDRYNRDICEFIELLQVDNVP